jgi:hypothetical protein
VIIEFEVDDVDKEYERLKTLLSEWVLEPTTMRAAMSRSGRVFGSTSRPEGVRC